MPENTAIEEPAPPEKAEAEEQTGKDKLEEASRVARALWELRAVNLEWEHIKAPLDVFACAGVEVATNPREAAEYREQVLDDLGFGTNWKERKSHLTARQVEAVREVLWRKALAFWLKETPRATVRFVKHDTIPTGPPGQGSPSQPEGRSGGVRR